MEFLMPLWWCDEATAGRINGGGGWLCGVRVWRGRVWRGGGWRNRLGGALGGVGRSKGGGWVRGGEDWLELLAASEGGVGLPESAGDALSLLVCKEHKGNYTSGKDN